MLRLLIAVLGVSGCCFYAAPIATTYAGDPQVRLDTNFGAWYLIFWDGVLLGRSVDVDGKAYVHPGQHHVLIIHAMQGECYARTATVYVPEDAWWFEIGTTTLEPNRVCNRREYALAYSPEY